MNLTFSNYRFGDFFERFSPFEEKIQNDKRQDPVQNVAIKVISTGVATANVSVTNDVNIRILTLLATVCGNAFSGFVGNEFSLLFVWRQINHGTHLVLQIVINENIVQIRECFLFLVFV